ncbi:MAG: aminotransferase class I/II-fold pyridoxal phosphate-dependent enzyme, partial [Gammaproteobacteria bacterium]|nr:aminotransferase class I/II-fold pyridoxal phosphate-dependent enzyme [Gammaproteobacteria bacterium]
GLRIGYSLSNPEIADLLNRVRQPFNTNLLAQEAALASLDDEEHIKNSVALNDQGKAYLQKSFTDLGLDYLPTMGNFISVNLRRDGQAIYDALLKKGVIVRPVGNYNMPDFLRITIGTEEQNQRFIKTLTEVLA